MPTTASTLLFIAATSPIQEPHANLSGDMIFSRRLNKPYVVLIGNHDFLGTGDQVWKKMFGTELDFSFIAARIKFICVNTNATEYDYMAAVPNFDYMQQQFHADSANFRPDGIRYARLSWERPVQQ